VPNYRNGLVGRARRGRRAGRRHTRVSQELGRPGSSPGVIFRQWGPDNEPLARGRAFWTAGSETTGAPPGIAKRRKRSAVRGTPGVAHLHSTVEAGEPIPRGPCGGKGDARHGPLGGNPMGALYPSSGSTQPPRTAKRARAAMTGRTGCLNWARPDRWELWGATPRATRPIPREKSVCPGSCCPRVTRAPTVLR
jgi:hypothetical protein